MKSILLSLFWSSDMMYGETSTLTISHTDQWFFCVNEKINIISLHIYVESSQLRILSFTLDTLFRQSFRRLESWMTSMINFDRNVKIISFELYNDTQVNSWSWKTLLTISWFQKHCNLENKRSYYRLRTLHFYYATKQSLQRDLVNLSALREEK